MSKNQGAYQHKELFEEVKKYDVNALRAFMYETTYDTVGAINYWKSKKGELIHANDKDHVDVISLEIARLESILLAKTQLTLDFFKIADIISVQKDVDILNTVLTVKTETKEEVNISQPSEKKEVKPTEDKRWGVKTLDTFAMDLLKSKTPDQIKKDLLKALLHTVVDEGDGVTIEIKDEATFNKYYNEKIAPKLVKATIAPPAKAEEKKEDAKIIPMAPTKIKLSELAKQVHALLTEGKDKEAKALAVSYLVKGLYIPNKEGQKSENWHDGRINEWMNNIKKNIKPVEQAHVVNEKIEGDLEIPIAHYDKLLEWIAKSGMDANDILGKDTIEEFKDLKARDKYSAVLVSVTDVHGTIKELKDFGIESKIAEEENEEEEITMEPNMFLNDSNTLTEEIQHIENLIKLTKELRGDKNGEPQNVDKIKELAGYFFNTRTKLDYEGLDKFMAVVNTKREFVKDSREFISKFSAGEMSQYTEADPKDATKFTTNCYQSLTDQIKADCIKPEFEEKLLADWVTKLSKKIVSGPTSDGKQVVHRIWFYTTYHILHFIDQIKETTKEEAKLHPTNKLGEPVATASEVVADASTEQETANKEKMQVLITNLESAILSVLKNAGVVDDAKTHPDVTSIMGMTVQDPWSPGTIEITEENFDKYVNKKWDEIEDVYSSKRTTFPVQDMVDRISKAIAYGQSEEDFVKDNKHLIHKKDGTYLTLVGNMEDIKIEIPFKNELEFLLYVKDTYALQKKLNEESGDDAQIVYELSSYKSFREFEDAVMEKAKTVKLPELQAWAKEQVLNKTFENETHEKPIFRTDNEANLDTYVEIMTKKIYITPETIAEQRKKIQEFVLQELPKKDMLVLSFVQHIKQFCVENKIDINLKDLRDNLILPIIKEHKKGMYDKYIELRGNLKKEGLLPDAKETPTAEAAKPEVKKEVIVETTGEAKLNKDLAKEISEMIHICKNTQDLKDALEQYSYEENKVAILKAVKSVVCDKKQISDMKLSEAEVNEWVTRFYNPLPEEESKTVTTDQTSAAPKTKTSSEVSSAKVEENAGDAQSQGSGIEDSNRKDYKDEKFDDLANAVDKLKFQNALKEIVSTFNDSSLLRNAIIKAIKEGKGAHTIKVAKQQMVESHKMIKKAYENYEEQLATV